MVGCERIFVSVNIVLFLLSKLDFSSVYVAGNGFVGILAMAELAQADPCGY